MIVEGALAMFVKTAEDKKQTLTETQPIAAVAAPAEKPAAKVESLMPKNAPSIISADLTIKGTLSTDRNLQIDGRIEGDIHTAGLVLCDQALIIGNIYAQEAVVKGRVQGTITAKSVHLGKTAHVTGDIVHGGQLSMEAGAFFEGSSRRSDRKNEHFAVAAE